MLTGRAHLLLLAAALCIAACAREDVELAPSARDTATGAGSGAGVGAATDAGSSSVPVVASEAALVFERGLCVCTSATFARAFSLDAFDSSEGAYTQGQRGANVGVNDQLVSTAAIDVRGAVIAAGSGLLPITNGPVHVEGNFETNADLTIAAADVSFGRDLRVNGEILAIGKVRVAGDVYQTPGHAGANVVGAGGEVRIQDFVVPTPCACGKGDVLDIDAIVAEGMADNHNQKLGVSDDALHTVTGAGALTLECGRYAVKGGKVLAGTAIEARGRVALFVAGDLTIAGKFAAQLGPDAEADVFVSGNLILVEGAEIGSLARPAALRFYVSGQGDIAVTGPLSFAANLYAPRASVYFTVDQESYGALFVDAYQGIADHVMHYDRAIARAGSMRASTCAH